MRLSFLRRHKNLFPIAWFWAMLCCAACRPTVTGSISMATAVSTLTSTTSATTEVTAAPPTATTTTAPLSAVSVITIPLTGPAAGSDAEISGMAWYDDALILLPQYPSRFTKDGASSLFSLSKDDIRAFLAGESGQPLQPTLISLYMGDLAETTEGFNGFEAIAFQGDVLLLTVEAHTSQGMSGYLVAGRMLPGRSGWALDPAVRAEILPQNEIGNKSDEALFVAGEMIVTLYETNGAAVNPSPSAHRFDPALMAIGAIPFPSLEYRLTDVTGLDENGRFWAINYFFPGDQELYTDADPLAADRNNGQRAYNHVERLVEFQYTAIPNGPASIRFGDALPIQLRLIDAPRNWEGIARLDDDGFLLVTDKFPETILGFVSCVNRNELSRINTNSR